MESLFGADFSNVRVQVGPQAPSVGALAFARGSHLHFAPGQYDPASARGRRLLAHELTHVVQQRSGRAKSAQDRFGPTILQDPGLEAEAERMGNLAAARPGSPPSRPAGGAVAGTSERAQPSAPARFRAPDAGAAQPIQRALNLGWVPAKPGAWRTTTTKVGNGPTTKGGGIFYKGKRAALEGNNQVNANAAGAVPAPVLVAPGAGYPVSDNPALFAPGALLTQAMASAIAPEVDHIVEKVDGGANDYENARLLSKDENNNPATPRPLIPSQGGAVAATRLRVYTPINIKVKNGPPHYGLAAGKAFLTGSKLSLNDVKALNLWSGAPAPANWAGFTKAMHAKIQAQTPAPGWKAVGGGLQIKVW